MVERIRTLLATRQLTPTQFADAIGVGRPIISHILSGRNKPSLEVVQKILTAFPDLSVSWLLSGQGEMQSLPTPPNPYTEPKTEQKTVVKERLPKRPQPRPSLFEEEQPVVSSSAAPIAARQPAPETVPLSAATPVATSFPVTPLPTTQAPHVPENASTFLSSLAEPGKAIRRIVIFYQDGTFSAYQPE
ncbi:helix-turn-helix domain-containing protein [Hymenobacter sp. DG25A]|uniref:helix-turn-helix domain-containing protein n=1 Tax=Hymenobacter sp. DG25A TaxID=1385663 RepID=UPI0008FFAE2C|nr:helix-turn-helix transcriptional regulator [Hymenobacter sp. DG25A]